MCEQLTIPGSGATTETSSSRWAPIVERWQVFIGAAAYLFAALEAEGFEVLGDSALSLDLHHEDKATLADLTASLSVASGQPAQEPTSEADAPRSASGPSQPPEPVHEAADRLGEAWALTPPEPPKLALGERTLPLPFDLGASC